ncbi:hypothetical protein GCM10027347_07410 [Larkinella harenae]
MNEAAQFLDFESRKLFFKKEITEGTGQKESNQAAEKDRFTEKLIFFYFNSGTDKRIYQTYNK